MKNGKASKRILSVTIKRIFDDSPDTSTLGKYSDRPETEFAIDRATEEYQGDIDAGEDWLQRIESRLEDDLRPVCEDHIHATSENCEVCELESFYTHAIDTVYALRTEEPFANVCWDRREYRYFNPGTVEKFDASASWIDAKSYPTVEEKQAYWRECMRKNAKQDFERMQRLNAGDWYYLGIKAEAEIGIPSNYTQANTGARILASQNIYSGGLWGIESDSDQDYIEEVEEDELADLRTQLHALGFSKRAISQAFKCVNREQTN